MKRVDLSLPEFGFVVATRAALGAGFGLLASARLGKRSRKRLGAALLMVGAVTTLPALYFVFGKDTAGGPAAGGNAANASSSIS